MTPKDKEVFFRVAYWMREQKHLRLKQLSQLVDTEEQYLTIIREIDRVRAQCQHARSLSSEATLTLLDWLLILDRFNWKCAYCRSQPFTILSHIVPLPRGGTTPTNCVPSCYSCSASKGRLHALQSASKSLPGHIPG